MPSSQTRQPAPKPKLKHPARPAPPEGPARSAIRALQPHLRFLGAFVRAPLTVGAFWPSSQKLARLVVDGAEISPGDTVVELGPGSGAFTGLVLDRLRGLGRFLAKEINHTNATTLRRRFSRCEVIHDSAENLVPHLGRDRADCIISGLAWGNMLPPAQNRILDAICHALTPGGQLVGFAYVHAAWFPTTLRFRRGLRRHFARVETTPVVWRNLPPAFVYRCWRD